MTCACLFALSFCSLPHCPVMAAVVCQCPGSVSGAVPVDFGGGSVAAGGEFRFVVGVDPTDGLAYSITYRDVLPTEGLRGVVAHLQKNAQRKHKKHVQVWLCHSVVDGVPCSLGESCPNLHATPLVWLPLGAVPFVCAKGCKGSLGRLFACCGSLVWGSRPCRATPGGGFGCAR